MSLTAATFAAIFTAAGTLLDVPLVKRLLQNLAKRTKTKLDDIVLEILYGAVATGEKTEDTKTKLAEVQTKLETATAEEKAELKSPSTSSKFAFNQFPGTEASE